MRIRGLRCLPHLLNVIPELKSSVSFGSIFSGGLQMTLGSEVGRHDALHLEKALCMLGRLEALHTALALSGRLMRILGTVIEIPMLTVSNTRHHHSFGGTVTSQLVRNHDARPTATASAQQLTKEADSSQSITLRLHQNVDHGSVLINRSP
jgi:hypothetical protein